MFVTNVTVADNTKSSNNQVKTRLNEMEKVSAFFRNIGLSEKENRIYVFLAKKGPSKASKISQDIGIERVQIYRLLNNLQSKGIIECTFEYPATYVAIPFRKLLDLQIRAKKEEAKHLQDISEELISQFDSKQPKVNEPLTDRFMVLDGRTYVYSRIGQMVRESKKTLTVVTSNYGIIQAYNAGLFDYGTNHPLKNQIACRFLTNLSNVNTHLEKTREILELMKNTSLNFEYNIGDFGGDLFPRFIIKDKKELLFFLKMAEENPLATQRDTGLWTNNKVLVKAFVALFGEMWSKSKNVFDKFREKEEARLNTGSLTLN